MSDEDSIALPLQAERDELRAKIEAAHIAWKLEQGHELRLRDAHPARMAVALGLVALVRWVSS